MNRCRAVVLAVALAAFASFLGACGGGGGSGNAAVLTTCGNGRLDSGERCDDGNLDDTDDCTSACLPARCGDGVVHLGVEQCDGANLNGNTDCAQFGLAGPLGAVRCAATCQYDTSACGAPFTPTPTPTDTPTPTLTFTPNHDTPTATPPATPTPTATPNPCGDGFLEPPEACDCSDKPATCVACPQDCQILACPSPGMPMQQFRIDFTAPPGTFPANVSTLVGYISDRVSLPATGASSRVKDRPPNTSQLVNNLGYAVRVLISAQAGASIPDGQLFTVNLDSCTGAQPVTPADFGCTVEGCGSSAGVIEGCICVVRLPSAAP